MSSVTLLVVTTSAWDPVTNVGTTPKRPMFPNDDRFTSPCRWRKTDKMMSYFSSIRETSNHGQRADNAWGCAMGEGGGTADGANAAHLVPGWMLVAASAHVSSCARRNQQDSV